MPIQHLCLATTVAATAAAEKKLAATTSHLLNTFKNSKLQ
jgi:hypothetical protein